MHRLIIIIFTVKYLAKASSESKEDGGGGGVLLRLVKPEASITLRLTARELLGVALDSEPSPPSIDAPPDMTFSQRSPSGQSVSLMSIWLQITSRAGRGPSCLPSIS